VIHLPLEEGARGRRAALCFEKACSLVSRASERLTRRLRSFAPVGINVRNYLIKTFIREDVFVNNHKMPSVLRLIHEKADATSNSA
jgi:hypothetical protein